MKVVSIVGARPQFIKAAMLSRALCQKGIEEYLVHTGQHYDRNLSDVFFNDLEMKPPDCNLGLGGGSHGEMTGAMIIEAEKLLHQEAPEMLVVYGDTNSTLAGAIAASKMGIPIAHVEAGLRSFNRKMPEEINRVLTDHVSALLFCPTAQAVELLKQEGITRGVHLTGDVMHGAIHWATERIRSLQNPLSLVKKTISLPEGEYYLATIHRAENTDSPEKLRAILSALHSLSHPVILPIHPRTKARAESYGLEHLLNPTDKFIPVEPVGYFEMIVLILQSKAVLTDSGGLQKEAYWLQKPCVTIREETEWTETVDEGWNRLSEANSTAIIDSVAHACKPARSSTEAYGDHLAAERMAQIIYDSKRAPALS